MRCGPHGALSQGAAPWSVAVPEGLRRRRGKSSFPPSLDIYLGKLYELGADDEVLAERAGLIKPLLYLLHGQAHHPDSFRTAVDAMLIHLTDDYARDSFLTISREFFYYWMTFPDAGVRHKKATLA